MGKRGQSFSSFEEVAEALKGLKGSARSEPSKKAVSRAKPAPLVENDFADMEAAMLAKGSEQASALPPKGKRREFEVQHTDRGRSKLVKIETPAPLPDQIKGGLLPKRPPEERKKPEVITQAPQPEVVAEPNAKGSQKKNKPDKKGRLPDLPNRVTGKLRPKGDKGASAGPISQKPPCPPERPKQAPPTAKDLLGKVQALFKVAPPPIEKRPQRALPWVRADIEASIALGAETIVARPGPSEPGYIIGCDFGTSSIKIAVRQPYKAGNPVAARPVPNLLQSNSHPYLWQSVLWFSPETDAFSLLPGKGMVALEGFKAGILAEGGGERVLPEFPVTRNEAAAAFLALQLSHCLGWYEKHRPLGLDAARNFLSINIGIPVVAQDQNRTYRDFRHIVSAARGLMPHAACLTHAMVRKIYQASTHELPGGFDLVPELTAAITGYANEPFANDGAHILIDVGASTLDVVAFNLVERVRVAAFAAEVKLLGAAALDAARSSGFSDDLFRLACAEQYREVLNHARHPNVAPRNFDATLRRSPVQLISIGGGSKTPVHKEFITRVRPTLGDLKVIQPSPPAHMTSLKCDASRLLLAYGLTSDIPEQLELRRPSEIPPIQDHRGSTVSFISKDVV
ncbi:hypothetical protein [Erythrobacter sp. WG]|uniref:hypothetical protein n=1 Tax=Erythrobacter sp. WG TaxID=2985510 RepID=UPI00226E98DF|nr:hypothetical protein [Erythrobacter sp. WG]MCX9147723.1 hypothetical protein [Erythrobacter sp. WG]